MVLAVVPVGGREGGPEDRGEAVARSGVGEGAAEPFAVRRVAAVHEEAQAHQVAGQAGGDDGRAEFVADLAAAADEGLLVGDALPLAGQLVEPQVVGVPAQGGAGGGQGVQAVVEDGSGGDLGEALGGGAEPVGGGDRAGRVEAERVGEPRGDVGDLDAVVDGAVGGAHGADVAGLAGGREVCGPAVEGLREVFGEDVSDTARVARDVLGAQEDLEARAPFVVGGARGVVAEDFGAGADARGGVRDPGGGLLQ